MSCHWANQLWWQSFHILSWLTHLTIHQSWQSINPMINFAVGAQRGQGVRYILSIMAYNVYPFSTMTTPCAYCCNKQLIWSRYCLLTTEDCLFSAPLCLFTLVSNVDMWSWYWEELITLLMYVTSAFVFWRQSWPYKVDLVFVPLNSLRHWEKRYWQSTIKGWGWKDTLTLCLLSSKLIVKWSSTCM